jgi:hypothetical protein
LDHFVFKTMRLAKQISSGFALGGYASKKMCACRAYLTTVVGGEQSTDIILCLNTMAEPDPGAMVLAPPVQLSSVVSQLVRKTYDDLASLSDKYVDDYPH